MVVAQQGTENVQICAGRFFNWNFSHISTALMVFLLFEYLSPRALSGSAGMDAVLVCFAAWLFGSILFLFYRFSLSERVLSCVRDVILFLSYAVFVSPVIGMNAIISVFMLTAAIAFSVLLRLRVAIEKDEYQALNTLLSAAYVLGWVILMTLLLSFFNHFLGWLLSLRLFLLVPACYVITRLFHYEGFRQLLPMQKIKISRSDYRCGIALALLIAGSLHPLLSYARELMYGPIGWRLGCFLIVLAAFLIWRFTLKYEEHLLGVASIVMLVFSVFLIALPVFTPASIFGFSLLLAIAFGPFLISLPKVILGDTGLCRMPLLVVSTVCSFLLLLAFPAAKAWFPSAGLFLTPVYLFGSLIASFFVRTH